ncbi:MAG: thermonuclease family protein [Planctomycetes bacterium]|nr:thermonuclease family protein [Planctomycetota bacterium]
MTQAKVTKVIDGDTFKIPRKTIRLANVNAPELGTKSGTEAKNQLKDMIQGKTITYDTVGKSYGRDVAKVKLHGKSVNQSMRNKLR